MNNEFAVNEIELKEKIKSLPIEEKIAFLAKNLEKFNLFSIDELDRALNKENTVHIAVLKSDMSRSVYDNLKKYQNFLNGENNE